MEGGGMEGGGLWGTFGALRCVECTQGGRCEMEPLGRVHGFYTLPFPPHPSVGDSRLPGRERSTQVVVQSRCKMDGA
jgi:hypothetical protein